MQKILAALFFSVLSTSAFAAELTCSYINVDTKEQLKNSETKIPLDGNASGRMQWAEVRVPYNAEITFAYLISRFKLPTATTAGRIEAISGVVGMRTTQYFHTLDFGTDTHSLTFPNPRTAPFAVKCTF